MTNLRSKFSKAAKIVSSKKSPIPQLVYGAYSEHLKNINTDSLPKSVKLIYGSIKDRLESKADSSDIGNVEAHFLAQDILCLADVIDKNAKDAVTIIELKDETLCGLNHLCFSMYYPPVFSYILVPFFKTAK